MVAEVVALLMFIGPDIKEHRIQPEGMAQCLRHKRIAERQFTPCLLYTSPSPRDGATSRMPSSA